MAFLKISHGVRLFLVRKVNKTVRLRRIERDQTVSDVFAVP